jgi:hypothetical protein
MDKLLSFEKTTAKNPELIRSNPKPRAETCASGLAGVEKLNGDTGVNGRGNTWGCTNLRLLASSCTNLHKKIYPRSYF